MSTFVLIPGAGGQAWYWHRVEPFLRAAGHDVVNVDLPAADESAGLEEYADVVLVAVGDREDLVVAAQSMGGFTAPLVCARRPVRQLVLLNAMIPKPGESGGEWWAATGSGEARKEAARREGRPEEFDEVRDFFHDVPQEVVDEAMALGEPGQADRPFADPWPLAEWPDVPTLVLSGRDDRLFPPDFQRRVARERLGLDVEEVPGGHLAALSFPEAIAERLLQTSSPSRASGSTSSRSS